MLLEEREEQYTKKTFHIIGIFIIVNEMDIFVIFSHNGWKWLGKLLTILNTPWT